MGEDTVTKINHETNYSENRFVRIFGVEMFTRSKPMSKLTEQQVMMHNLDFHQIWIMSRGHRTTLMYTKIWTNPDC